MEPHRRSRPHRPFLLLHRRLPLPPPPRPPPAATRRAGRAFFNKFIRLTRDVRLGPITSSAGRAFFSRPIPLSDPRSSSITFGSGAVGPSVAASFTPMVKNPKMETFYYVQLIGISVHYINPVGVAESDLRLDPSTGRGGVMER